MCDFVHQLESQIQNLKERIEVLENRSKKTLQIVINHLLQMVFVNLLQKGFCCKVSNTPKNIELKYNY
nr:hypothetical protein [Bacillus toyonensis]